MENNQVAVYQGDFNEEFPVLKAFQQFINEEQNKARKRLLGLCIFFTVLMMMVVILFITMMMSMTTRNQQLNDRLIEFAMRERTQQAQAPVIVQQPHVQPAENTEMKAMSEMLANLQRQLAEQQQEQQEMLRKAKEEAERQRQEAERQRDEAERLRNRAEERRRIAEENERKRQEEIERHRRRLYPEYYARLDAEQNGEPLPPAQPQQPAVQPKPVAQPKVAPKPIPRDEQEEILTSAIADLLKEVDEILKDGPQDEEDDNAPAITYFNEDEDGEEEADAYEMPLKLSDGDAKWRVPLD